MCMKSLRSFCDVNLLYVCKIEKLAAILSSILQVAYITKYMCVYLQFYRNIICCNYVL